MEELTMVLLTIPLFFPIVTALGFDPVWFGVLIVMIVQIGLISPPVGMNLFVLNSLLPDVGLGQIFRGCWPFVLIMVVHAGPADRLPAAQPVAAVADELACSWCAAAVTLAFRPPLHHPLRIRNVDARGAQALEDAQVDLRAHVHRRRWRVGDPEQQVELQPVGAEAWPAARPAAGP